MIKKTTAKLIRLTPEEYRKYVKNSWRDSFDRLIVILGLINVVATIPQVVEIWSSPHAKGVSIITWTYYVFFTGTLLVYAFLIKSKPMIISYSANSIIYTVVLISAIIVQAR
ncbi:hypothetical protein H7097_02815 [Aeromicrobium sp.]|nr:hypothetical protein [Candidatus Saccharibacteria bacterium]